MRNKDAICVPDRVVRQWLFRARQRLGDTVFSAVKISFRTSIILTAIGLVACYSNREVEMRQAHRAHYLVFVAITSKGGDIVTGAHYLYVDKSIDEIHSALASSIKFLGDGFNGMGGYRPLLWVHGWPRGSVFLSCCDDSVGQDHDYMNVDIIEQRLAEQRRRIAEVDPIIIEAYVKSQRLVADIVAIDGDIRLCIDNSKYHFPETIACICHLREVRPLNDLETTQWSVLIQDMALRVAQR